MYALWPPSQRPRVIRQPSGVPLNPLFLATRLTKAAAREGEGLVLPVTKWTPHDLRRTARTLLASIGCPNEVAEAIMGHMPADIVGTYNLHSYDSERRHWLTLLSQRLESL